MPNRYVRQSILTSKKVEQLDFPAEVFFRRLINVVDDFGRYDAEPAILRAALYPLRIDRIREADISRWLAACEMAGLIALYQVADKPYLELHNLGEPRARKSKYPPNPANGCEHVQTSARTSLQAQTSAPPSPSPTPSPTNAAPAPPGQEPETEDQRIRRWIQSHPMLGNWDQGTHDRMAKVVAIAGWDKACELVEEGIVAKAGYPIGWALAKAQGQYVEKAKVEAETPPPRVKRRSAVEFWNS